MSVGDRLVESDAAALRGLIGEIKVLLDAHVGIENEQLYPPLIEKAQAAGETSTAILAKSFQDGMSVITGAVDRLVARHQTGDAPLNLDAFTQDWNMVLHALRSRFQAEESSLYPMYRRLVR